MFCHVRDGSTVGNVPHNNGSGEPPAGEGETVRTEADTCDLFKSSKKSVRCKKYKND